MTTSRWLDDDEVIASAAATGWRLAEQPVADARVWRWLRFTDEIWPSFRQRLSAIVWMRTRLMGEHAETRYHDREQLIAACGLLDEMVDCNAQLHTDPDGPRRVTLERAIADRATQLRGCVDVAEVFVASGTTT